MALVCSAVAELAVTCNGTLAEVVDGPKTVALAKKIDVAAATVWTVVVPFSAIVVAMAGATEVVVDELSKLGWADSLKLKKFPHAILVLFAKWITKERLPKKAPSPSLSDT